MAVDHKEKGFEAAIEADLLSLRGYQKRPAAAFNGTLALQPADLVGFFKATQPDAWNKLQTIYGAQVETKVPAYAAQQLDQQGTLNVLRRGISDRGVKLQLAYFRPSSGLNAKAQALYDQNVLTVTRQVHYATKDASQSIDVVLCLNGIPVATAELKNPFTNQTVKHAINQYRFDRDPGEPLLRFKTRALVHFAVDPDQVYKATKLAGKDTKFLPFNKGRDGGAGNPDNPNGYRTSYLWEWVWSKDVWLDILARFIHLQREERDGKVRETLIFPRYHQLDAVLKLIEDARLGAGRNCLIQHSAGSGKSNSIAWLAHRLANLHDAKDQSVFDSVLVITDRRILDNQLQDTIFQLDHQSGVVERISHRIGAKGAQLEAALKAGKRIIVVTQQTFSADRSLNLIGSLPDRRYAVIIDEAHSGQTGEGATNVKKVLSTGTPKDDEEENGGEEEDEVLKAIAARGPQPNLSFFAFTATPKKRTLELFGRPGSDGRPQAFHLYSMRQAIEEGFILDVLAHYTTYKTYYRLTKAIEDDPTIDKAKARTSIARFVSLHPHNLAEKTQVMVEHFRNFTRQQIGGRAKAMPTIGSRRQVRARLHLHQGRRRQSQALEKSARCGKRTIRLRRCQRSSRPLTTGLASCSRPLSLARSTQGRGLPLASPLALSWSPNCAKRGTKRMFSPATLGSMMSR